MSWKLYDFFKLCANVTIVANFILFLQIPEKNILDIMYVHIYDIKKKSQIPNCLRDQGLNKYHATVPPPF